MDTYVDKTLLEKDNNKEFRQKTFLESRIFDFNYERDRKLKLFIIDNIEMNEDILYKMAVKFNTTADDEKIRWIDADNKVVEFNKADFGALIKKGTNKVEDIYFKFRKLKDDLLNS